MVVRAEDYPQSRYRTMLDFYVSRYPTGVMKLSGEAVSMADGAVTYSLFLEPDEEYSRILSEYRKTSPTLYPIGFSSSLRECYRKLPWFDELGDSLNLTVSGLIAKYACDRTFALPH